MSNDSPALCAATHSACESEFPGAETLKPLHSVAATPETCAGDKVEAFQGELRGLISEFMRKEGLGQVRSAKRLKVRTSKLSRWLRGLSLPNKKDVGRLDRFFDKNGQLILGWRLARTKSAKRCAVRIRVFSLAEYASRVSEK